MQTNVLVTGGAGFIGSHVVERLIKDDYTVRIVDNLSTGKLANIHNHLNNPAVSFIEGDIRDQETINQALNNIDAVIHLAAQTSVPYSITNPDLNNTINITASKQLLLLSIKHKIKKFIFASSCAVYGDPIYQPIDEKHPTNPLSPYAQSKLAIEKECLNLSNQKLLQCTPLRFFNVYGPRQGQSEYSGVITKFIEGINKKQNLTIFGDGSQTRDFVFVDDIVSAIMLALTNSKASGQIFNVGTGKATTIKELAQEMLSLTSSNQKILNEAARPGDIYQSKADITQAKEVLKYTPHKSLTTGLKKLLTINQ
jgi:UDP-glucose 4-epimerase